MRTAIYVRVSTDEQAKEGFSIMAQKAFLERKAEEQKLEIHKEYIDDGYSAKDTKRPALQQLLADIERREIDVVFFWRLDRLTRKSRDFHKLTEQLQKFGVGLKSASEPIDTTTAIGRFQLELSVSLAQLERETISERVTFVMEERTRKGIRNGGPAPYGYDLVDKTKLVINEQQAEIITRIFDMYLSGTGFKKIAHYLTRNPEASGNIWSGAAVKYILENPVYIGKVRWNHIGKNKSAKDVMEDGEHEKIVDELTFQRVQNEIKRRAFGGKRFTTDFLFSSVLTCARCGNTFQGNSYMKEGRRYRTYRCSGKIDKGICTMPNIGENSIINVFLDTLNLKPEQLDEFVTVKEPKDDERERINEIRRELETIAKRKQKWQTMFANDLASLEEVEANTKDDRKREEELKRQLEHVRPHTKSHWTKSELVEQLSLLRTSWHYIDNDKAKKLFIQEAIEYMVIDIDPDSKHGPGIRTKAVIADMRFRV